ncbi:MAG: DsrE family protein [Deltaproteobacteria bacterium]|nr:DsrE family protein [Deltaproteobacteria bacterium]
MPGIKELAAGATKIRMEYTTLPNGAQIEALQQGGAKMHECNVAMRLLGYEPKDIFPFSRVVVSGVGAVIDFEKSGYLPITP